MSKAKSNKSVVSRDFTSRLASARGRFVGITTVNSKGKVTKYNAQVRSQSDRYVTVFDRNRRQTTKLAKNSIVKLSGV